MEKAITGGRTIITLGVIFLVAIIFSSEALSWSWATHTYIDDHLGRKRGMKNTNEIYGSMVPDLFNYMFENPDNLNSLYDQTHNQFMKMWNIARSKTGKALAYGFVSHNDRWGADFTAHHAGRTYGQAEGYAKAKAKDLLTLAPLPSELGIPEDVALEIFHELVENSVDILISQIADPVIGRKMISAAIHRSPVISRLLVETYAGDFSTYAGISYPEAVRVITSAEKKFRRSMVLYGQVLLQDEATAIELISEQTADVAQSFLAVYGIPLPPREQVVELIAAYMELAISICESDYFEEIEATVNFVDEQLKSRGISY
jgi:hypothetical protein